MAISFVNEAAATALTLTYPTGIQAGDYILYFGYRTATTAPSVPSGFTNITTGTGDVNSMRLCYKIAAGTESGTTSPTYTNATQVMVAVYRGVGGIGNSANHDTTTSPGSIATITVAGAYSWVVGFAGSKQGTSQAVSGMSNRGELKNSTTSMIDVWDTNGIVSTFSAASVTLGSSTDTFTATVELYGSLLAQTVSAISGNTTATVSATLPNNVTAGNVLVVACYYEWGGAIPAIAISDNKGNSYTLISESDPDISDLAVFYAYNVAGGSTTVTITGNAGNNYMGIIVREYNGLLTTSNPFDKFATNNATTGTAISSGASTATAQASELVVGVGESEQGANTYTLGALYGNLVVENSGSIPRDFAMEDKTVQVTGTQTATFTLGTSAFWIGVVATFKTGASGGGPSTGPIGRDIFNGNNNLGANIMQAVNRASNF